MVRGLSSWHALLWVAIAVAAAVAVLLAARLSSARLRMVAFPLVAAAALFAGYVVSGPELELLRPRHWDELFAGLAGGMQTLGTVRLPYASADPWPRIVLELLGTELLILAGLLTFWPRAAPAPSVRTPLAVPDRGYPFIALAVLIVVVASPVVSLGGPESLLLGLALAALSVCFLWLERLPLRPGLGVAALLAIALAGALPLAAMADRGEPWFDYRSFAESLGPDDPVRFSWKQGYGPIDWPRDGNEVMRVSSVEPLYWKARNLDEFDGTSWTVREEPPENPRGDEPFEADLPEDWTNRPSDTSTIEFSIRRVRTTEVFGAGTSIEVRDSSRSVQEGISPGTWDAPSAMRRGDSYSVQVHVPSPTGAQLDEAKSGDRERQDGLRTLVIPFKPGKRAPVGIIGSREDRPTEAVVNFAPFDGEGLAVASYPEVNRAEFRLDRVMARSPTNARGSSPNACARAPRARWTTSAPSTTTCTSRSSATSSARRSPGPASRRWTSSSTTRTRATASISRARWRCCCGWAACRRGWRRASRRAASQSAMTRGSSATPTRTPGSRCGSTRTAG